MTRKDFNLIAGTIARQVEAVQYQIGRIDLKSDAHREFRVAFKAELWRLRILAASFAEELKATNERFDRRRFIEACGFPYEFEREMEVNL